MPGHPIILSSFSFGTELWFCPTPGYRSFFISVRVPAGSLHDPIPGLAHMVEHMLFRGNKKLGSAEQIFYKVDALASEINASTGIYSTEFWIDGSLASWQENLEILMALVFLPEFQNLTKEKSVIAQEIRADLNEAGENIDSDDQTFSLLWPKSSLGQPIFGSLASIQAIKKHDLVAFHQAHYQNGPLSFAVTGDLDPQAFAAHFEATLGRYRAFLANPSNTKPWNDQEEVQTAPKASSAVDRVVSTTPETAKEPNIEDHRIANLSHSLLQPHDPHQKKIAWNAASVVYHLSYALGALSKPDKIRLEILAYLLESGFSSYLVREIRENLGLVYEISTSSFFYQDCGVLSIRGETSIELFASYQDHLRRLLEAAQLTNFQEQEFRILKAKKQLQQQTAFENPKHWLLHSLEEKKTGQFTEQELLQELDNPDKKPITDLLARLLMSEQKVEVVLAPPKLLQKRQA